ncbi:hypothetical protein V8C42DRAFT_345183 [Trichoderma barbatum]
MPLPYELPTTAAGMARLAARPERLQYRDEGYKEHDDDKEVDSPMNDYTGDGLPSSELIQSYNNSIANTPQSIYSANNSCYSHSGSHGVNSWYILSPYVSPTANYSDSYLSQLGTAPEGATASLTQHEQTPHMSWDLGGPVYHATESNLLTVGAFGMMPNTEGPTLLPENNDHSILQCGDGDGTSSPRGIMVRPFDPQEPQCRGNYPP